MISDSKTYHDGVADGMVEALAVVEKALAELHDEHTSAAGVYESCGMLEHAEAASIAAAAMTIAIRRVGGMVVPGAELQAE